MTSKVAERLVLASRSLNQMRDLLEQIRHDNSLERHRSSFVHVLTEIKSHLIELNTRRCIKVIRRKLKRRQRSSSGACKSKSWVLDKLKHLPPLYGGRTDIVCELNQENNEINRQGDATVARCINEVKCLREYSNLILRLAKSRLGQVHGHEARMYSIESRVNRTNELIYERIRHYEAEKSDKEARSKRVDRRRREIQQKDKEPDGFSEALNRLEMRARSTTLFSSKLIDNSNLLIDDVVALRVKSMQELVVVRGEWDAFLSPRGGQSIPIRWVEPNLPSDHEWAQYLTTTN